MSIGVVEESIIGRSGEEASLPISPSMEGILPIRGVHGDTGEVVAIPTAGLREAEDPYRVDVVRWAALDVPSIMVAEDMKLLRDAYRIPSDIELLLPDPNERACFPRMGCTALSLNAFVSGMRLPLYPFFRRILRAYGLATTQVSLNGWGQMVGGLYLWFRHSFGMEMPLHVFQTMYLQKWLPTGSLGLLLLRGLFLTLGKPRIRNHIRVGRIQLAWNNTFFKRNWHEGLY
ncbi:Uncharacterized protein Adt_32155 [Abeliophyllum distichum]|uniref:Transposase (putative) gypsy type domain-containing protein n=1 Tax=Abeliophyllum distichum TaxID=126358 RepID=A0ABD1RG46_9LAMI